MRSRNPTLLQFMDSWQGEQCWLRAQAGKIYLQWDSNAYNNNPYDRLLSKGIGVFGNIINQKRKQSLKESPVVSMQEGHKRYHTRANIENQYVINVRSKSPLRLGQMACQYGQQLDYKQKSTNKPKLKYPTTQNKYSFKFPNNVPPRTPKNFDTVPVLQQHQGIDFQSIMESIKEIRLPDISNSRCTTDYQQANRKFEQMKQDILEKIANDNIQFELDAILGEIQDAADQIILKHKMGDQPKLKKNPTFSFRDFMLDESLMGKQQLETEIAGREEEQLKKIVEEASEDNSNMIRLPPFQDDAGSISSIASDIGHRKAEEDSGKIDPVFIVNAEEDNGFQSISLKQCTIPEKLASKLKSENHDSAYIRKSNGLAIQQSLKPQPTQPVAEQKSKAANVEVNDGLPLFSKFGEENSMMGSRRKPSVTTYLPHDSSSPIKVAKNLQQAKEIDPNIIKFTEYKVKFLQPRIQQPKVITYASPLRFRRKEEVVKHLVANNIIDKESDSIEHPL